MIAIIDYGVGNLQSVMNSLKFIGADAIITSDKNKIADASHIILPGVGAFGSAMENLKKFEFVDLIKDEIQKGKPFLGICLGMQMLLSTSTELGEYKGLDIIKGKVLKFDSNTQDKIPQMGWNSIKIGNSPIFKDIKDDAMMYFVHSFYVKPENDEDSAAITNYAGIDYTSAITKDNIFATQFHPEKSGTVGLKILKNFTELK